MHFSICFITFSSVARSDRSEKFILCMPSTALALDDTLSRLSPRRVKMMDMRLRSPTWFSVKTLMVKSCCCIGLRVYIFRLR